MVMGYELVDPSVITPSSPPVVVAEIAERLQRVAGQVAQAVDAANQAQHEAVAEILAEADPQAWLFVQRAHYVSQGFCDPYAEQMLRRMGLLPTE
ncbi:MAG: hypothetical protein IPI32_11950 [Austwickia sp.]|nr:hypothetical protein [Austwickia sp.]MBK8434947.1 hypothetical protein [Austwickia sp.]MBK9101494.1 hypothetical protein [Austwickia sp.]